MDVVYYMRATIRCARKLTSMILSGKAKLIACTKNTGTDKATGREFVWYKYDVLSEMGVVSFTGSHDYSLLVDEDVSVVVDFQGKDKARLVQIEPLHAGERVIT